MILHNNSQPKANRVALLLRCLPLLLVLGAGAASAQLTPPSTVTFSVMENTAAVGTLPPVGGAVADRAVTYALAVNEAAMPTSADNGLFNIAASDATPPVISISFKAAPDFELPRGTPVSSTNGNAYRLNVLATEAVDPMTMPAPMPRTLNIALTVTVTDVNEAPLFSLGTDFPAAPLTPITVAVDRRAIAAEGIAVFVVLESPIYVHDEGSGTVTYSSSDGFTGPTADAAPAMSAATLKNTLTTTAIRFAALPAIGTHVLTITATPSDVDTLTSTLAINFVVSDSDVVVTPTQATHILAASARSVTTTALDVLSTRLSDHPRTVTTRIVGFDDNAQLDSPARIAAAHADPLASPWADDAAAGRVVSFKELIGSSSFVYGLGNGRSSREDPWSIWGEGAFRSFEGQPVGTNGYEGETFAFHVGLDWRRAHKGVLGIAFGRSKTTLEFENVNDADTPNLNREFETNLNIFYPYAQGRFTDQLTAWGVLGLGNGRLGVEHTSSAADEAALADSLSTGLEYKMAAAGAKYLLNGSAKVFGFALKGDVFVTELTSDAVTDSPGANTIQAQFQDRFTGRSDRFRLAFEFSYNCRVSENVLWLTSVDVAARVDRGAAEEGLGVEISADTQYRNINNGLALTARGNFLVDHNDSQYKAWGVNFGVSIDPGSVGKGMSLSLNNSYGEEQQAGSVQGALGGANNYLQQQEIASYGQFRTSLHAAYGLDTGRFIVSPFVEMALRDSIDNTKAGARFKLADESKHGNLEMAVYAQNKRVAYSDYTEEGVFVSLNWRR